MTEKFTSMTVDGNCLYLRRLGKEKKYMVEDIHSVEFRPCRGFVGTSFVIVFNDGKTYWFDRDCHCGVQNVYNELIKRMK